MSAAGGQDDQRLVGEVPQGCGFLRRGVGLDVLVDRAAKVVCGRDAGAELALRPRWQAAGCDLGVEAAQAKSSRA